MNNMHYDLSKSIERQEYDDGLREYMISVYQNMGMGLLITAVVAYFVSTSNLLMSLVLNPLVSIALFIATIGIAVTMTANLVRMEYSRVRTMFFSYSALIGLSLSGLFLVYTGVSIVKTFLISASLFGVMSIYGQSTKHDLSGIGSFLIMGIVGIIISSLVNLLLRSPALDFAISIVGVLLFTLMTAYDNQAIKRMYYAFQVDRSLVAKIGIYGALQLYLDFINLFIYLLRFLGVRRSD